MCFNPSPERRVPSPNRYMAFARFCFCKNNKRTIIISSHVSGENCKACVLTRAQQIVMDFWVLDDAKLLNILLNGMGLGAHERIDKCRCANGHTHAFQACHSDDVKLG